MSGLVVAFAILGGGISFSLATENVTSQRLGAELSARLFSSLPWFDVVLSTSDYILTVDESSDHASFLHCLHARCDLEVTAPGGVVRRVVVRVGEVELLGPYDEICVFVVQD